MSGECGASSNHRTFNEPMLCYIESSANTGSSACADDDALSLEYVIDRVSSTLPWLSRR
jgi:hypothetical protein